MARSDVPAKADLLWPTLVAVNFVGGSASISEITVEVITTEDLDETAQSQLHLNGPQTELEYNLAWARTYLKGMGLLENSSRGVWSLTEKGHELMASEASDGVVIAAVRHLYEQYVAELRERRAARRSVQEAPEEVEDTPEIERTWKDELLEAILAMPAEAFERLAQRLLREAGFTSTRVTGRSGDQGIDGVGVYQVSLLSFPIFYQCKRYRESVGPGAVRDFRGAMAGRGDKGLLITTGTFTSGARDEATREGAPPIDLIDGSRLCDLLRQYELGVTTRTVEEVVLDLSFFHEFRERT